MNEDQIALDPTLLQLFNELLRAHRQIGRLQERIAELEGKPQNGRAVPEREFVATQ